MNKTDNELMKEYGITSETKTIYSYKQHSYECLKDALNYAEIDSKRHQKDVSCLPGEGEMSSNQRLDD